MIYSYFFEVNKFLSVKICNAFPSPVSSSLDVVVFTVKCWDYMCVFDALQSTVIHSAWRGSHCGNQVFYETLGFTVSKICNVRFSTATGMSVWKVAIHGCRITVDITHIQNKSYHIYSSSLLAMWSPLLREHLVN